MANIFYILSAALMLLACTESASNAESGPVTAVEDSSKTDQANPEVNSELQEEHEAAKVIGDQSQRQKRFYDYFDLIDFPPNEPNNNNNIKRDYSQNTGVYGSQDFMLQILRRVQTILRYTRQQAYVPPVAHFPVPSFIPLYYIPRGNCGCNPASPGTDEDSSNTARPTQPTTATPPADSTTQGTTPANEPGPSPTDDTNITTPDFSSRLPEMVDEEGDGSRPISFVPIKPKTPLSRPPPPVDHGSSQASIGEGVKNVASTTPRPIISALPAQPHLPTNTIPTLCDGAVLTCCHRAEVTYECFESQGCPNPTSPNDPCDKNVILRVINKFQYYYANRRG